MLKQKGKKYTSKDIKDIRIVKKKETDGLGDVLFGKSTFHYLEIIFKKGTAWSFQISDIDNNNKKILKFVDEYVLK